MFQSQGVPEFWIVDVDARIIERWRPTDSRPEVLTGSLTWPPPFEIPPLVIDLDA